MVVCDGPTEDSTAKFWQMVWDERCAYLIMLTPQDGDVREHRLCDIMSLTSLLVHSFIPSLPPSLPPSQYHCYWPNFGSLRQYGNLIVEVEEESAEHVYTTRKLLLTDSKVAVNILSSLDHAVDTQCSLDTQYSLDTLCSLDTQYSLDTLCSLDTQCSLVVDKLNLFVW